MAVLCRKYGLISANGQQPSLEMDSPTSKYVGKHFRVMGLAIYIKRYSIYGEHKLKLVVWRFQVDVY